jgi:aryl-alcohol dehydrogenase-like predicted oxidoreductase
VRNSTGALKKDFSKQHIFLAVDGSLKRLRTDYIDLYQIHNPTIDDLRREEIQEAMEMLQDAGKVRSWGVSVSTVEDGIEVVRRGWAHVLQVLYNVINQAPATDLFPLAKSKGYGIIARVPLASGLLTGKFRLDTVFAKDDVRQNFLTPRRLEEVLDRIADIKSIVGGAAPNLAQAALEFVLANEAVSTTIPGARNARQVESNVAAAEGTLPRDVVEKLRTRLGDYNFYQRHAIRI